MEDEIGGIRNKWRGGDVRNMYKILVGKPRNKIQLGR
jgi:hypothetical protein